MDDREDQEIVEIPEEGLLVFTEANAAKVLGMSVKKLRSARKRGKISYLSRGDEIYYEFEEIQKRTAEQILCDAFDGKPLRVYEY
jgi:hypothetical protein